MSAYFRKLAEAGEALAAAASRVHGLPVPARLRRRRHVVKALKALAEAKAKAKAKQGEPK